MKLAGGNAAKHEFDVPGTFVGTDPITISFEKNLDHWGLVRSMEFYVYRDGRKADDVSTHNIGFKETPLDHKFWLTFECLDPNTVNVRDHKYVMNVTVNFYEIEE